MAASAAYISSYDKSNKQTVHLNSAGAIPAAMQYAIWDKETLSARIVCPDPVSAEAELRTLLGQRGGGGSGKLCVVTVPV